MKLKKQITLGTVPYEVVLNDEEEKQLMQELLDSNTEQFKICYEKARDIAPENDAEAIIPIALALFDKQATASFTVINSALEEKKQELVKKLREKMREKK